MNPWSASLWGCELKYTTILAANLKEFVSLLVRLWVEIHCICRRFHRIWSQPPCEAVSWNTIMIIARLLKSGQPPCEAVSWNVYLSRYIKSIERQPPCEAVSWNIVLKERRFSYGVSLLVRLWVEIWRNNGNIYGGDCQPPCEAVSWNGDTFAANYSRIRQPPCEAVSWNAEFLEFDCFIVTAK